MPFYWSQVPGWENSPLPWRSHVLQFEDERDEAIESGRCFCICGCGKPGDFQYGFAETKICLECSRMNTHKVGTKHELARMPADTYRSADDLAREVEAVTYVNRSEKIVARPTTPYDVERVLAKRDREVVKARTLTKRSDKTAFAKRVDIGAVPKGSYVVQDERGQGLTIRVERPTRGSWKDFTFVVVDPQHADARGGMQRPGEGQFYLGRFEYLVSQLPQAKVI